MAGSVAVIAWGLWCIIWAPNVAARYQRALAKRSDNPDFRIVSPREVRWMGIAWVAIGIAALVVSLK